MAEKPPKPISIAEMVKRAEPVLERQVKSAEEDAAGRAKKAMHISGVAEHHPEMKGTAEKAMAQASAAKEKAAALSASLQETRAAVQRHIAALPRVKTEGIANVFSSRGKTTVRLPMSGKGTRRNTKTGGDIVTHMLTIRNQVKLYHWQTGSFARHKATDDLTAALDLNIDAFVESYMGRYGRPSVSGSIKLHNFSESAAKAFVAKETKYLQTELPRKIGKTDTDLLNLRDTILGDLTKVLYLFTLQ
jgi:hypothetical protein